MNNRKRNIIFPLFLSLSISALFLLIIILTDRYDEIWFAAIPLSIFPICIMINILQEKSADKKYEKKTALKASISESVVRQQILENYEVNIFREITADTMADDLKEICRKKYSPKWLTMSILPLLFLPVVVLMFMIEKSILSVVVLVFLIILFCGCAFMSVYSFSGLFIKGFSRKSGKNFNMIERSYMGGRVFHTKSNTINIGIDYCVYTDLFGIGFFRNNDVLKAVFTEKRTKKYDRFGFYAGENNEMYVSFFIKGQKQTCDIHGSQLQLEYICDELLRCGIKVIK